MSVGRYQGHGWLKGRNQALLLYEPSAAERSHATTPPAANAAANAAVAAAATAPRSLWVQSRLGVVGWRRRTST